MSQYGINQTDELDQLLQDAIIKSYDLKTNHHLDLTILHHQNQVWKESKLSITEIANFYFQRFENGMERQGIRNLHRLKLGYEDGTVEWIKEIKPWQNVFTHEQGVEIELYNGFKMRFMGNIDISYSELHSIDDIPFIKPTESEHSAIKVIHGINRSIDKKTKPAIEEKVEKVIEEDTIFEEPINDESIRQQNEDLLEINDIDENENKATNELIAEIDNQEENLVDDNHEPNTVAKDNDDDRRKSQMSTAPELLEQITEPEILSSIEDQTINQIKGVTKLNRRQLLDAGFDTIDKIAKAKQSELIVIKGIGKPTARKIIASAKEISGNPND